MGVRTTGDAGSAFGGSAFGGSAFGGLAFGGSAFGGSAFGGSAFGTGAGAGAAAVAGAPASAAGAPASGASCARARGLPSTHNMTRIGRTLTGSGSGGSPSDRIVEPQLEVVVDRQCLSYPLLLRQSNPFDPP